MLEDAFVLRDVAAVARLFAPRAVLVAQEAAAAHGRAQISRAVVDMWTRERTYLADVRRVTQLGDTALVLGAEAIHVVRRGRDRSWRYAISLLGPDPADVTRLTGSVRLFIDAVPTRRARADCEPLSVRPAGIRPAR